MTPQAGLNLTKGFCLLLVCLAAGCGREMTSKRPPIHVWLDMDLQAKYKAQSANQFFYNGMTMQQPVPGTIAQGELPQVSEIALGKDAEGNFVAENPFTVDEALTARGADRYGIFCMPCHRANGDGQGIMYQYGGVPTRSLHEEKLLTMPDGEVYNTITNGFGLMPSYAYPISVEDRWAIVAYVRELQRKQQEQAR